MPARKRATKPKGTPPSHTLAAHAPEARPGVILKSYNLQLQDEEGFVGDRASGKAFRAMLGELRAQMSEIADDPLGKKATKDFKKKELDKILADGDVVAAGVVQGAVEEF